MTKISRLILEAMAIIQEDVIMVEQDTITKFNIKTTLKEGQDAGYVTKNIISVQIVLRKT